jgi:UDP-glucose 6-dehydrogenase
LRQKSATRSRRAFAVGTPDGGDGGGANVDYVFAAVEQSAHALAADTARPDDFTVVVTKSTVPAGTSWKVSEIVGNMAKVLVFGGAGYVGSHCCKALAPHGLEPVVYDNFSTGHPSFVVHRSRHPRPGSAFRGLPAGGGNALAALALVGPPCQTPARISM